MAAPFLSLITTSTATSAGLPSLFLLCFFTMASTCTASTSSASSVDSRLSVRRHQTIDCPSLREWLDKEAQRQWEEWNSSTRPKRSRTETDLGIISEHSPQHASTPSESSTDISSSGERQSPRSYSDEQAWLSVHCAAKGPMAPPPPKIILTSQLRPTPNQSLAYERNRSRCESLTSTRNTQEVGILSISGCPMGSANCQHRISTLLVELPYVLLLRLSLSSSPLTPSMRMSELVHKAAMSAFMTLKIWVGP